MSTETETFKTSQWSRLQVLRMALVYTAERDPATLDAQMAAWRGMKMFAATGFFPDGRDVACDEDLQGLIRSGGVYAAGVLTMLALLDLDTTILTVADLVAETRRQEIRVGRPGPSRDPWWSVGLHPDVLPEGVVDLGLERARRVP